MVKHWYNSVWFLVLVLAVIFIGCGFISVAFVLLTEEGGILWNDATRFNRNALPGGRCDIATSSHYHVLAASCKVVGYTIVPDNSVCVASNSRCSTKGWLLVNAHTFIGNVTLSNCLVFAINTVAETNIIATQRAWDYLNQTFPIGMSVDCMYTVSPLVVRFQPFPLTFHSEITMVCVFFPVGLVIVLVAGVGLLRALDTGDVCFSKQKF